MWIGGRSLSAVPSTGARERHHRRVWVALIVVSAIGCSPARPIERATSDHRNRTPAVADAQSRLGLTAMVLDETQSNALLHVSAGERDLLPVTFTITNGGSTPLSVRQDDFRLRLDDRRLIAPALPGRAASLLRDNSGSTGAMWAGYLAFGVLAAPALHDAEKTEEAAMRSSREVFFSSAEVSPGAALDGYLVFEIPVPVVGLDEPVLQMSQPSGAPLEIYLSNPYAGTY